MNKNKIFDELNLIYERSKKTGIDQIQIGEQIESTKRKLMQELNVGDDFLNSEDFRKQKSIKIREMNSFATKNDNLEDHFFNSSYDNPIQNENESLLTDKDFREIEARISSFTSTFNKKYNLDKWDYAIAVLCGTLGGLLDSKFVERPLHPKTSMSKESTGGLNSIVQSFFNFIASPETNKKWEGNYKIGSADTSISSNFLVRPSGSFTPTNHRLLSLSHDPILGIIIGVLDTRNNTCTIIDNGKIKILPSRMKPENFEIFQMFGHLLSDVNSPSNKGNRGMGIPTPFMGILRMLEFVPIRQSNFANEIDYLYKNGYDFRQFITVSIPVSIMTVLVRCLFVVKQMKVYDAKFGETLINTMPTKLKNNPRFRLILTMAYGIMCGINAGKVYVTRDILNVNYTSWMGLVWHGIHSLKWLVHDKPQKFWEEYTQSELSLLMDTIKKIDDLDLRSQQLPLKR